MSRPATALVALLALAGCAGLPGAPAEPTAARLMPGRAEVTMSDGATCVGLRTDGQVTPTGWQGQLAGCGHPLSYAVTLNARDNPVQWLMGQLFAVIGLDGALAASGRVVVTDARGRTFLFTSPPSDASGR